jgi:hypothetical protein
MSEGKLEHAGVHTRVLDWGRSRHDVGAFQSSKGAAATFMAACAEQPVTQPGARAA